ncbi:MAG: hypothetical protein WCQ70_12250, partial [Lentimicrobiaceae bacterium]
LLKYHTFDLKAGTLLYRSRICESPIGLPAIELGAPNSGKAIDGVEYISAMHEGGVNYAFFDQSKFKLIASSTKEVKKVLIETGLANQ